MGFPYTKQCQPRLVATVVRLDAGSAGVVDTTLVGNAELNPAKRIANLAARQIELQEFTNGVFVEVRGNADGLTGTLELWLFPEKGMAQFLGIHTFTTDEAVDDDGLFCVDEFVVGTAAQHTNTILNMADGSAVLKLDTLGCKYLVALVTAIGTDDRTVKVFARAW